MMKQILYQSSKLPAMQNVLFSNKEEALKTSHSELCLVMDPSGYVVNSAFNPDLVEYNCNYQNDQSHSAAFQKHLEDVAQYCKQFLPAHSGVIVDVGCGKGGFVNVLRSHGLNAIGYDNTYEGSSPFIRRSFFDVHSHETGDLLTLRHVLEHIQNPWEFIRNLAKANDRKGFLYVEVPDLQWILKNSAHYDLFHEHVNYFCLEDFSRCFQGALRSSTSLFEGQYLGVILDLSLIQSDCPNVELPLGYVESLVDSFHSLAQHEESAYMQAKSCERLVIWGAASKGVIFAAKAPPVVAGKLAYAIDINPSKANCYMPLSGLLVVGPRQGLERLKPSDTVVIVNPNYEREVVSCLPPHHPYFVLR